MCHRKEAERQDILRRIRAAGCPIEVDLPAVDSRNELLISQAGEAYIFDLGTAGAALVLWMRLARAVPGQIWIVEFGDVIVPLRRTVGELARSTAGVRSRLRVT